MLHTHRKSRISPQRQTLTVEALENRTLLNGTVTASLTPAGLLQITGDGGDNQITLAPSPIPGQIRLSGDPGSSTSINGAASADFALADVTDIWVALEDGMDRVTVTDFSIPGGLTILYGGGDVFSVINVNAATVDLVPSGSSGGFGGIIGSGQNDGLLPPPGGSSFGSGNTADNLPPVGGAGAVLDVGINDGLVPPL